MAFVEDMTGFFNSNDFAVTALYKGTVNVNVIVDMAYQDQFGMVGTNPIITAAASDFTGAVQGQTLNVNGQAYKLHNIEPDGTGIVRIELVNA